MNHNLDLLSVVRRPDVCCLGWLDLIIRPWVARLTKGGIRYEYPFRTHPPWGRFRRGVFNQDFMDEIIALWQRLYPNAERGGRVRTDTIELRATVFAIGSNNDFCRKRRHDHRRALTHAKIVLMVDDQVEESDPNTGAPPEASEPRTNENRSPRGLRGADRGLETRFI